MIQEARSRIRAPKRVLFVSSSSSWFSEQIAAGLAGGLSGLMPHEIVRASAPVGVDERSVDAQLAAIRTATAGDDIDAIVIRPAGLEGQLLDELVRCARAKIQLVFVNSRPPAEYWQQHGLASPMFAGCDMAEGGRVVGDMLCSLIENSDCDAAVLLEGPDSKPSNAARTAWAARQLLSFHSAVPTVVERLESFEPELLQAGIRTAVRRLDRLGGVPRRRIAVYTGTDRAALHLADLMSNGSAREIASVRRDFFLIGFDGLRGPNGELLVAATPSVIATVDQQPYALGTAAAALIVDSFRRRPQRPLDRMVEPRLNIVRTPSVPRATRSRSRTERESSRSADEDDARSTS